MVDRPFRTVRVYKLRVSRSSLTGFCSPTTTGFHDTSSTLPLQEPVPSERPPPLELDPEVLTQCKPLPPLIVPPTRK